MKLRLTLTPEQAAQVTPHMRAGFALLGRIMPEPYTGAGANAATSGRLSLELGAVKESALPSLRDAIRKANEPAKKSKKKKI